MPCYHPCTLDVERKALPGRERRTDTLRIPCGSCLGCRTNQARQWAIRIMHEEVLNGPGWFVTLTYSDQHIPDNGSLNPRDATLFLKRLRRRVGRRLSYFLCGEYGETTERPHYHAVLLGPPFPDRVLHAVRDSHQVWVSDQLDAAWGLGLTEFSSVSYKAAAYVSGYLRKKVRQRDNPDHYTRVDSETGELVQLVPEFGRMSTRPALGRTWIERYWTDVYPRDYVVMDGVEMKPPRYYDKWMEENHPSIMHEVREARAAEAVELNESQLEAGEYNHRSRVRLHGRRDEV